MTDRELLEYAAKAAGIAGPYDEGVQAIQFAAKRTAYGEVRSFWDPLHDDAEAFRLAVTLKIDLRFPFGNDMYVGAGDGDAYTVCLIDAGVDRATATRRAIVCAAAKIGAQP